MRMQIETSRDLTIGNFPSNFYHGIHVILQFITYYILCYYIGPMIMASTNLDCRGIPRGPCTMHGCRCSTFVLITKVDIKCQSCQHPPAKHVNLSYAKSDQANTPFTGYNTSATSISGYTTTTSTQGAYDSGPSRTYSSVAAARGSADRTHHSSYKTSHELTRRELHPQSSYAQTTSSYSTPYTPSYHSSYYYHPQPKCQASDCNKPVFFDDVLGHFNYCSPQCRDQHILPEYNQKLDSDIAEFEARILKLNLNVKKIVLEKKARAPFGVLFTLWEDKVLVGGLVLKNYQKQLEQKELQLLATVEQICDNPPPTDLKKVESFTVPRTKIVLELNCINAVKADFGPFLGQAKNATHIFALNDFAHEYNFKAAKEKHFVVKEVNEFACETMNGLKISDRIICYASYKDGHLFETVIPTHQIHNDLLSAAREGHVLLVAISRK